MTTAPEAEKEVSVQKREELGRGDVVEKGKDCKGESEGILVLMEKWGSEKNIGFITMVVLIWVVTFMKVMDFFERVNSGEVVDV